MNRESFLISLGFVVVAVITGGLHASSVLADSVELEPGQMHVDYAVVSLDAEPGQFVLAPNNMMLERAVSTGRHTSFIYYGGVLVEVGEYESSVRNLAGRTFTIPNAMIIPVQAGYQAEVGDVLLGRWESGSGLRRAMVIGGSPDAPLVRYLDRPYEADKADEQREDTLRSNRYMPLTEAWQIGTTIACGSGNRIAHGVLVHDHGDRILGLFHAGRLEPRARAECVGLPPNQSFADGDAVFVPGPSGNFTAGTVKKVEADIGRIWVEYTFGGRAREMAFAVVDVARTLENNQ
jgi:hypothetical protein